MPDITQCKNDKCKVRDTCYRYYAKPDMMQSYFMEYPGEDESCEYYYKR